MRTFDATINGTRFRVSKLHKFTEPHPSNYVTSCEVEISRGDEKVTARANSMESPLTEHGGTQTIKAAFKRARRYIVARQARAWAGVE